MRGFDKHLHELLEARSEVALEHAKPFAELPLLTHLAIMRRRRKLSQQMNKQDGADGRNMRTL